jgi:hypothetical protein
MMLTNMIERFILTSKFAWRPVMPINRYSKYILLLSGVAFAASMLSAKFNFVGVAFLTMLSGLPAFNPQIASCILSSSAVLIVLTVAVGFTHGMGSFWALVIATGIASVSIALGVVSNIRTRRQFQS